MRAVYEAADRAQAASVYWLTQEFNAEGRALYDTSTISVSCVPQLVCQAMCFWESRATLTPPTPVAKGQRSRAAAGATLC